MPCSSTRGSAGRREPREHLLASGGSWRVRLPQRAAAALGACKPLAVVEVESEGDGREELRVPTAVARALEGFDGPEPQSRAELVFRLRELADSCAYAKVVELVSRREHSRAEARERLLREGFSRAAAERAVDKATSARILSDRRFADAFIRSKLACGWGPMRIERELARKGVEAELVEGWPHDYLDGQDPAERAYELVERRRVPEKNGYAKLVRFLVSRGYSLTVAKDAVRRRLDDEEQD